MERIVPLELAVPSSFHNIAAHGADMFLVVRINFVNSRRRIVVFSEMQL